MANRNERKRQAKARRQAIEQASLDAISKAAEPSLLDTIAAKYPLDSYRTVRQKVAERDGKVIRGKFVARPLPEPAKRVMVHCPDQNRLIERRRKYIA